MNSRASARAIGGSPDLMLSSLWVSFLRLPPLPLPTPPLRAWPVQPSDLRIALFSGNYNYVRDGANQALNRLVDYLLRQGAQVRVYSPTVADPAFKPTGTVVSVPSVAIPCRPEYRIPLALTGTSPPRPRGIRSQHRPHLEPGHRRPPRRQLGSPAQHHRHRLDPHPLRNLPGLLSHGDPRAGGSGDHAAALSALRRDRRAGGVDRRGAARATHEPRHLDLVARRRPQAVPPRAAQHGMAAKHRHSPTTRWSSASSAGW